MSNTAPDLPDLYHGVGADISRALRRTKDASDQWPHESLGAKSPTCWSKTVVESLASVAKNTQSNSDFDQLQAFSKA
ncbi:hypothetical protein ACHAO9_011976, partial [Fusarium lateritium]